MEKHVVAVQGFSGPKDKLKLQHFLGLVNFYCWFMLAATNHLLSPSIVLAVPKKIFCLDPIDAGFLCFVTMQFWNILYLVPTYLLLLLEVFHHRGQVQRLQP